ncbi:MAG TPA: VWA domain-containing protein [Streptosporangiaceae bacterium]|jgi:hypothetical protein
MTGDIASVAAGFGAALRDAGLPVGAERCERFARAVLVARPRTQRELLDCALATLASGREEAGTVRGLFAAAFGDAGAEGGCAPGRLGDGGGDGADGQDRADAGPLWGARAGDTLARVVRAARERPAIAAPQAREEWQAAGDGTVGEPEDGEADDGGAAVPVAASAAERLAGRDFAELSEEELLELAGVMRGLTLAVPVRWSRRRRRGARGKSADLRATLRGARQSGAEPFRIIRTERTQRPRKLVVLCDISGSMEPYARAMLQLLYCAAGGARAEVFSFATRLTRLTRALAEPGPDLALRRAGQAAPDWLGGTRIGASLKEFNDRFGLRGTARGAVVVMVSDGWDTGDPAVLRREMERLARVAFRIVWVNPRAHRPGYRPLAGGMAAAWPFCDAVVSAHRLDALGELTEALAGPGRRRTVAVRPGRRDRPGPAEPPEPGKRPA